MCNLIEAGCFVRYIGRLTGFVPRSKVMVILMTETPFFPSDFAVLFSNLLFPSFLFEGYG